MEKILVLAFIKMKTGNVDKLAKLKYEMESEVYDKFRKKRILRKINNIRVKLLITILSNYLCVNEYDKLTVEQREKVKGYLREVISK